jgi:hypothetical protein
MLPTLGELGASHPCLDESICDGGGVCSDGGPDGAHSGWNSDSVRRGSSETG